jgi:dipeptidyl-peptidase-4
MALLCLMRAPDVFRAGVAGAPVVEWEGYDTHYTERYMETPRANPEGYRRGSVLTHVGNLAGKLLLVHGMIDENVHFRHSARLLDALVKAGKPPELLLFPDERHLPRSERDRAALEARIVHFFETHLA